MTGPNPRPGQQRGKTTQGTTPKGGKRQGAGRKPLDFSNEALNSLVKAIRDLEKVKGESAADQFAKLLFDKDKSVRIRAFKIYYSTVKPDNAGNPPQKEKEPALVLPEKKPIGEKAAVIPMAK